MGLGLRRVSGQHIFKCVQQPIAVQAHVTDMETADPKANTEHVCTYVKKSHHKNQTEMLSKILHDFMLQIRKANARLRK